MYGMRGDAPDPAALADAAAILKRGGLVAFPTETVYGLGADAASEQALARLTRVKGRPPNKPYSLHLHSADQVRGLVTTVPPAAQRLMTRFWPGPLTIVLPTGRGATVGLRLPDHPIARAFLQACGDPVVAPSANRSGSPPPTDAAEVLAALGDEVDCVLDAGPSRLGRESTVVEIGLDGRLTVLREGAIAGALVLDAAKAA